MTTDESWHLKKEVSIGTLVAVAIQLIILLIMFVRMDERISRVEGENVTNARVSVVEQRLTAQERSTEKLEARTLKALDDINAALRRIEQRIEKRP